MTTLSQVRRDLYLTQRMIGDYQAAQRGPGVLGKRILRRHVTRHVGQSYSRLWRAL
jgi:hypothetical protein